MKKIKRSQIKFDNLFVLLLLLFTIYFLAISNAITKKISTHKNDKKNNNFSIA